jgi:predicted Zn-dependent protease
MSKTRLGIAAALLVVSGTACARNPATGARELAIISLSEEVEMGREAAAQVGRNWSVVSTPELREYVQTVGLSLARQSERPSLSWQFSILDDSTPNAFAMPGGFIFITRGMLQLLTSEAQLASVLGHEIGHVSARHTVTQLSRWRVAQMALGLGGVSGGMQAFDPLAGLEPSFLLFYSEGREAERQADQLGFSYMRRTGYAVSEFAEALKRTSANQQKTIPSWLSTHPSSTERIATAEKRIFEVGDQPDARMGRAEYLEMLARLSSYEN